MLPTRSLPHKTSVFASFTHSSVFWKMFESFVVLTHQVSCTGTLIEGGCIKIDTTLGATLESDSSFHSATSFHVLVALSFSLSLRICLAISTHLCGRIALVSRFLPKSVPQFRSKRATRKRLRELNNTLGWTLSSPNFHVA